MNKAGDNALVEDLGEKSSWRKRKEAGITGVLRRGKEEGGLT